MTPVGKVGLQKLVGVVSPLIHELGHVINGFVVVLLFALASARCNSLACAVMFTLYLV